MAGKDLEQLEQAVAELEAKMDKLTKLVQQVCESSKPKEEPFKKTAELDIEPIYVDVFSMPDVKY